MRERGTELEGSRTRATFVPEEGVVVTSLIRVDRRSGDGEVVPTFRDEEVLSPAGWKGWRWSGVDRQQWRNSKWWTSKKE